ncbi:cupin domain-containing protein [Amycolatopsis sp. cmx-11-51]|uniref:cupin domain-containing protein n=1 Tax=unclassified Amycolatopsis TaxID=2618356 RepID=UPI0039E5C640
MPRPADITAHLGLQPLPVEGGRWAQSWRDETASAIYYLLEPPETSAPHRLDRLEIYAHHTGAPVRMLLLFPDGRISRPVLGLDVAAGQRPQVVVPAGVWQASTSTGEWSLLGTVVVPPYTDDCVEFRSAAALAAEWPGAAEDLAPWLA